MMKKLFLILAVAALSTTALYAQQADTVVSSYAGFKEVVITEQTSTDEGYTRNVKVIRTQDPVIVPKWHIGIQGGAQVFFGRNDVKMNFGQRIAPDLQLTLGRKITPVIGIEAALTGAQFKGVYTNPETAQWFLTGKLYTNESHKGEYMYWQKGCYMGAYLNLLFDFSTWFGGLNPDRVSSFIPYIGSGWVFGVGNNRGTTAPSIDAGLIYDLRLAEWISFQLNARGALVKAGFGGETCDEHFFHGSVNLAAGVAFRFGKGPFGCPVSSENNFTYTYYDKEAKRLEQELANAQAVADAAQSKVITAEAREVLMPLLPFTILFDLNRSVVTEREKVNLSVLAKAMIEADAEYVITGYADKQTGKGNTNQKLSNDRANSVYKVLTEEFGVPESKLSVEFKGGVGNMYYDNNELSRCVVITSK